jgi:hypothetical protein
VDALEALSICNVINDNGDVAVSYVTWNQPGRTYTKTEYAGQKSGEEEETPSSLTL